MKIEVIDKDGWRKAFSFEKTLFHIGSAAMNDLVLDARRGAGVAARHAQLIALPDSAGYRLVNLGDASIGVGESDNKSVSLAPHNVTTIGNGSVLKMGDFTLIFHGETPISMAPPTSSRSPHIGLRLSLPHTKLAPHQTLIGTLTLGNHGDRAGVQFDLELEGMESDCYRIEPAPLLSSGAESDVTIRFYHRGSKPPAGEHAISIHAIASQAYPGEEAAVTCLLHVQPFFKHTLRPALLAEPIQTQPAQTQPVQTRKTAMPQDLLPPPMPSQPASARPQETVREPVPAQAQQSMPPVAPVPRAPTPPPENWWSIPEKTTTALIATPPSEPTEQGMAKPDAVKAEAIILPPSEASVAGAGLGETPAVPVAEPDETPETKITLSTIEPESTGEVVTKTPPSTTDDWWSGAETRAPEEPKPEVLVLKATDATLPDLPAEADTTSSNVPETGVKSGSASDDWWSET